MRSSSMGASALLVMPLVQAALYEQVIQTADGPVQGYAAFSSEPANIASFGGDPDHVTVMGQSAGSAAAYHMLNGKLTQGAIVGAIIQSGVRDPHDPLALSLAEGYQQLNATQAYCLSWMASVNCSDVACLRALPSDALDIAAQTDTTSVTFKAVLDHYAIPDTYASTLAKGTANKVPVLTGSTRDESGASYGLDISLAAYLANLNATYSGDFAALFFAAYGANDSASASAAQNAQFTDRSKVGTAFWAEAFTASEGGQDVYTYLWDHIPPGDSAGASHESEIQYTLNNLYYKQWQWEADDYAIAEIMSRYWVNFIKTGDPNGDGLATWAAHAENANGTQQLGEGFGPVPIANAEQIALFAEWFASLPAL